MSKFCPIRKERVLYLECLECEEKTCRNTDSGKQKKTECTKGGEYHE